VGIVRVEIHWVGIHLELSSKSCIDHERKYMAISRHFYFFKGNNYKILPLSGILKVPRKLVSISECSSSAGFQEKLLFPISFLNLDRKGYIATVYMFL